MNIKEFIARGNIIHNDKYDYSKVNFENNKDKICIICPEHGEFYQSVDKHIYRKQGCPKCAHPNANMTTEEFIEKAKRMHGDKYDYSNVEYRKMSDKVCIICPEHGEFWQTPKEHLNGHGCSKCKMKKHWDSRGRIDKEDFIRRSKEVHGDKYDYSKVEYIDTQTKVCIICPEHGEFWQTPNNHLQGQGCKKCKGLNKYTTEEWVEKAKQVHGDKYDYSKVEYVSAKTKVCIICPEHGEFWQLPYAHIKGQGCPSCDMSHLENEVHQILIKHNIKFINESDLNGKLGRLRVDFYLPELNLVIECQGGQHFYPAFDRRNKQRAEEIHKKVVERDIRKRKILDKNQINVLYYCSKDDFKVKYFEDNEFNGLYCNDNLKCMKQDIELIVTPQGVSWD